jgi:hypothetical protein
MAITVPVALMAITVMSVAPMAITVVPFAALLMLLPRLPPFLVVSRSPVTSILAGRPGISSS